jgi:transposase InsO family protein
MLDLFSRRIVGWQTSHRIDRQLVCDAFNYAMARQVIQLVLWFIRTKAHSTVVVILERCY